MSLVQPSASDNSSGSEASPEVIGLRSPRRVVVVDDHELLRAGTRRILDDATGYSVVGEAEDGVSALRVIADTEPDVVLVDIRLPNINGIDLARQVMANYAHITVLILTAYDDEYYVRAALAAGVAGYLLKTMPSTELVRSITAACEGARLHEDGLFGQGEKAAKPSPDQAVPRLTTREQEVIQLVARGMSNKAIGHQLGISPRTVEGHMNHIFEKLDASSRTELVHYALANTLFVRGQADQAGSGP
jgi:DNA-binding NarL/FixJ family response regulator